MFLNGCYASEPLTAEMFGALVLRDGCLRLDASDPGGESYLLVWPPAYDYRVTDGVVQIIDGSGREVVTVGQSIRVDGGAFSSRDQLQEPIRQASPEACEGPFWLIGQDVSAR